jgi:hypothetical protein
MGRLFLVLAVVLVAACASPTRSDVPSAPVASASDVATPVASTAEPSAAAVASPPTKRPVPLIVGEWVATQDCQRIVAMLGDAGLDEFVLEQVYDFVPGAAKAEDVKDPSNPCDGAVQRVHSHFFTFEGQFGSKDFRGQQVDDGTYRLEGEDVVVIGDQPFHYRIDGDQLTLEPPVVDISGCTSRECRFAATWVLMVAMPGTTWTRGEIPVS